MKKLVAFATLTISVLLISCHHKDAAASAGSNTAAAGTTSASATGSTKQTEAPVKAVTVDAATDMNATGAAYTVDSMSMNKNILSVFVTYSGGCKEHTFELLSNGMYAKSLPPQVSVVLKHTNNGDNCRELVMKELKFDVSALKYKSGNTTIIKMGDKRATYTVNEK